MCVEEAEREPVWAIAAAQSSGLSMRKIAATTCLRLLREIHGVLLAASRGAGKAPGEFRRTQNWLGGSRPGNAVFVPPPPERLMGSLGPFEHFLHDEPEPMPLLIKAALAQVQFETIHPFLDGNGRLGRMLITLLLCPDPENAERGNGGPGLMKQILSAPHWHWGRQPKPPGICRCRPWRATRRLVVRGRGRARTDFRSGEGVQRLCPAGLVWQ